MHFIKKIAVYSDSHTKHTNTICGQNVALSNAAAGGTHNDYGD